MSCLKKRRYFFLWVLWLVCPLGPVSAETKPNACLSCHAYQASDFSPLHGFAYNACASCHAGEEQATELPQAHNNLIAKPGDLNKDRTICANCHPQQAGNVQRSLMNTGKGLVKKTRLALGESDHPQIDAGLESLGDSPADSMLRKLCANCHLANTATWPVTDITLTRGGGCSACHINQREKKRHPRLTAKVEDGRCFGCHSRSGRISLNYVGLAEADPASKQSQSGLLQLPDGRTVVQTKNDIHHQAGMSCIDCHTSTGIMGGADNSGFKQQAVDIVCNDCHVPPGTKRADQNNWPAEYAAMQRYLILQNASDRTVPLTQRHGTPLWHIEIQPDGSRLLHPKLGGSALPIPDYKTDQHPYAREHARLDCSACHSQWAPQCYGCHTEYDPAGKQWDHLQQKETAGRWHETRWDVRAQLPALGVDPHDRIRPVTPGMIMHIEHPDLDKGLFRRLFAISEPHTTGRARTCESCHRSAEALALGTGMLHKTNGTWTFQAAKKILLDGLPADAWTSLDGDLKGQATDGKSRPFNQEEMELIINADISR